ncbi:hypothetical protein OG349_02715 [Streptomyces sp. NBC_01317]|uniref:hypothetical protein n=1 Tax=Streptomyces sp. NBC_01317 TaxID=2903822 RepID=UPI002E15CA88|nr:hypothetical protein OG349_02715 [Streptomyces sp. NBC_01317]
MNYVMLQGVLILWFVVVIPWAVAVAAGWKPPWLRRRPGSLRLVGAACLCLHLAAVANLLPRLAHPSQDMIAYCSYLGTALAVSAVVLFISYLVQHSRAARTTS